VKRLVLGLEILHDQEKTILVISRNSLRSPNKSIRADGSQRFGESQFERWVAAVSRR